MQNGREVGRYRQASIDPTLNSVIHDVGVRAELYGRGQITLLVQIQRKCQPRGGLVRPARLERATSWFVGQCRGLDSRDFVPVARVDPSCCGVFGFRLFTDCSLRDLQRRPLLFACRATAKRLS